MDALMRKKRLFLRKQLSRDDMAREVLTNRTYITRALKGRGLNFSQFVNAYRAQYAIELMLSDRYKDTPPEDIAEMSGYIKKSAGCGACAMREKVFGPDGN